MASSRRLDQGTTPLNKHCQLDARPVPGREHGPGCPRTHHRRSVLRRCAGGITEGIRQAGYRCPYGNDRMAQAIDTFSLNHPDAWGDARDGNDREDNPVD